MSHSRNMRWLCRALVAAGILVMAPISAWAIQSIATTEVGPPPPNPPPVGCYGWKNTAAQTATGFKFVADAPSPYYFTDFSVTPTPSGTVQLFPNLVTNPTKYTVVISGISIPNNDCFNYSVHGTLDNGSCANAAHLSLNKFLYPAAPDSVGTGPDFGWRFNDIFVSRGPTHAQTFKFYNRDAARTITLGRIVFSQAPAVGAVAERDSFAGASGATLVPGDSLVVNLTVPLPPLSKTSAIYALGTMTYTGTGGGSAVSWAADHEEQLNPFASPGQSEWGMFAVLMALMAWGIIALRKRVRTREA